MNTEYLLTYLKMMLIGAGGNRTYQRDVWGGFDGFMSRRI